MWDRNKVWFSFSNKKLRSAPVYVCVFELSFRGLEWKYFINQFQVSDDPLTESFYRQPVVYALMLQLQQPSSYAGSSHSLHIST